MARYGDGSRFQRLQNRKKGEGTWWSKTKGLKAAVCVILKKKNHASWVLVGLTWERKGSYCWVMLMGSNSALKWAPKS